MSLDGAAEFIVQSARQSHNGVLGIIGTAKNVGKSSAVRVALRLTERPAAVCSVGRDGESVDAFDGRFKPALELGAGMLAVTSSDCIVPGRVAICAELKAQSATGALFVVRTLTATSMQISGPRSGIGIAEMLTALRTHGARMIYCDGALDRMAGALGAGGIRSVLLATGAALANGIDAIVENTVAAFEHINLKPVPPGAACQTLSGVLDEKTARELPMGLDEPAIVIESPACITRDAFMVLRGRRRIYVDLPTNVHGIIQCAYAPESSVDPQKLERALFARLGRPILDCLRNTVYAG